MKNRFFDDTPPLDKIAELKALIAEASAVIAEGKQIMVLVETIMADLKVFLGK